MKTEMDGNHPTGAKHAAGKGPKLTVPLLLALAGAEARH